MNFRFDIDEWLPRFPLAERHGHYSGEIITGPGELCNNEHLRAEMQDQFDWGPSIPMDIFVMADGEPANRWVTKIGGLPYRPSDLDWPTTSDGRPLFFLAQFDFTDSLDLVGELPGDVLLVFADDEPDNAIKPAAVEWQTLGKANLMMSDEIPAHRCSFAPCYGHIYRTESFPNARQILANGQKHPKCRGKDVWASYHLPQYQATQIGEAPSFIQGRDDEQPGRILCTISSIHPDHHGRFPFMNRPAPLMPEGRFEYGKYLMIGDVGCIYISIDEAGEVYFSEVCY